MKGTKREAYIYLKEGHIINVPSGLGDVPRQTERGIQGRPVHVLMNYLNKIFIKDQSIYNLQKGNSYLKSIRIQDLKIRMVHVFYNQQEEILMGEEVL